MTRQTCAGSAKGSCSSCLNKPDSSSPYTWLMWLMTKTRYPDFMHFKFIYIPVSRMLTCCMRLTQPFHPPPEGLTTCARLLFSVFSGESFHSILVGDKAKQPPGSFVFSNPTGMSTGLSYRGRYDIHASMQVPYLQHKQQRFAFGNTLVLAPPCFRTPLCFLPRPAQV